MMYILNFIKKQKLSYFGHIKRHQTLGKFILEGKEKGQRNRGRPKRYWEKDVEDWMGASVSTIQLRHPKCMHVCMHIIFTNTYKIAVTSIHRPHSLHDAAPPSELTVNKAPVVGEVLYWSSRWLLIILYNNNIN